MLNQLADRADARDVKATTDTDGTTESSPEGAQNSNTTVVAPPPAPPPVKRTDHAPSPPDPSLN
jgi:hypothetical protein